MPPQLQELLTDDGETLYMVRGTDPAEILTVAVAEADSDDMVVTTELGDVAIVSIRAMPCRPERCEEKHSVHYVPTREGSRGSFRGAFLEARPADDEEIAEREARCQWGVGESPSRVVPYACEETALWMAAHRDGSPFYSGRSHVYYRADGGTPWRRVETVSGGNAV